MSVSKSETNIPKIRKPFSAELIPRVPYITQENVGVDDTTNKLVTPVIVKNRQIVEAQQVTTKEYVDGAVVVDPKFSSGTNVADITVVGTKKEIKVPIASESTAGLIKTVKNASFVGTNANGELVSKTITIPDQTPLAGDIIDVNGRTVAVKNAIPAGYAGPIGINANRQLVTQSLPDPTHFCDLNRLQDAYISSYCYARFNCSGSWTSPRDDHILFVHRDFPNYGGEGFLVLVGGRVIFEWSDLVGAGEGSTKVANVSGPSLYLPIKGGITFTIVVTRNKYKLAANSTTFLMDDAFLSNAEEVTSASPLANPILEIWSV